MRRLSILAIVLSLGLLQPARAEELTASPSDAAPPEATLSEEVAARLQPQGVAVRRDGGRTMCQVWLAREWEADPQFEPSETVLYPFSVGELLGAIEFKRTAGDFRGQEIPAGVYTMRYALQPVDGNHVGTSLTRDFVLLIPAADDPSPEVIPEMELFDLSKQTAESTHPAMLCLLAADEQAEGLPRMKHDSHRELWSLGVVGQTADRALPLELVVVGQAAE